MDPEHLRSTMADATEKAATAAAAAATVADADADADAADTLEDDKEPGTMFAEHEMQKLVSIERVRAGAPQPGADLVRPPAPRRPRDLHLRRRLHLL